MKNVRMDGLMEDEWVVGWIDECLAFFVCSV